MSKNTKLTETYLIKLQEQAKNFTLQTVLVKRRMAQKRLGKFFVKL